MARITITHTTTYRYRNPVVLTRHRMMLRPDDSHDLRLHDGSLDIDPKPLSIQWAHDPFNNSICSVSWPESLRTERLSIVSTLDLTHHPAGADLPDYTLAPGAESLPFSYPENELPDLANLIKPQTPDPEGTVAAWARGFVESNSSAGTVQMLAAMTHAIKANFRYQERHAFGTQTAAETLGLGSGTCRDFAVLMIEALRHLGLAARFVTGYLYDEACGTTRGGGSTHAWCSVYLPGAGWVEYDPTNGLLAGANLIRVGVTRTAEQASPISGGYIGDASDSLGLDVCVAVTARPIEPPSSEKQ